VTFGGHCVTDLLPNPFFSLTAEGSCGRPHRLDADYFDPSLEGGHERVLWRSVGGRDHQKASMVKYGPLSRAQKTLEVAVRKRVSKERRFFCPGCLQFCKEIPGKAGAGPHRPRNVSEALFLFVSPAHIPSNPFLPGFNLYSIAKRFSASALTRLQGSSHVCLNCGASSNDPSCVSFLFFFFSHPASSVLAGRNTMRVALRHYVIGSTLLTGYAVLKLHEAVSDKGITTGISLFKHFFFQEKLSVLVRKILLPPLHSSPSPQPSPSRAIPSQLSLLHNLTRGSGLGLGGNHTSFQPPLSLNKKRFDLAGHCEWERVPPDHSGSPHCTPFLSEVEDQ